MIDYYELLSVEPQATQAEIRKAYRFLAMAFHPDRFGEDDYKALAEQQLKEINHAYSIIGHQSRRAEYDRTRAISAPAAQPSNWAAAEVWPTSAQPPMVKDDSPNLLFAVQISLAGALLVTLITFMFAGQQLAGLGLIFSMHLVIWLVASVTVVGLWRTSRFALLVFATGIFAILTAI